MLVEFRGLVRQGFFLAELPVVRIELKFRSVVTTLVQESKAMPPRGENIPCGIPRACVTTKVSGSF